MSEENKAVARRWNRIFEGDMGVADDIVSSDCVYHDAPPGVPSGPEGVNAWASEFQAGFTDLVVSDEETYSEGDMAVSRFTAEGTHNGEFVGISPTGNRIRINGIQFYRISGGKIVEHWVNFDAMGLMQQIGATG
jgi:predicted ester cyclase